MDNQMLKKKLDIKFSLLEHRTAGQRFYGLDKGHTCFRLANRMNRGVAGWQKKEKYYVRIELVTFRTKDGKSHRATMTNR